MVKGFTSLFKGMRAVYDGASVQLENIYATLQYLGAGKVGLMTAPRWLSLVSSGNTLDASGSTKRVLAITGHSLSKYDVIRFTSGALAGHEVQVLENSDADSVMLAQELPSTPAGSESFSILIPMTPTLDASGQISIVEGITTIVDFLDAGSMVPTGANVIPKSSDPPLEVVNSLAQNCTKIQVISDIGEFINLYTDAAGATLIAHVVLTPDEVIDVDIPAGSKIYIRAAKDVAIDDINSIISMNFIG
jgi:hypothetical protein